MFLAQVYKERLQRKVKKARAAGIAEGKAEGIAEGIAEGKAEERHLWLNWNNRRIAAEAKGEDFSEPLLCNLLMSRNKDSAILYV